MPSDYEAITQSNIRRLGEDTDQYRPLINLYANPTHFIYELLQNADDYKATSVLLQLFPEALVLEHDGIPFEENNVKAISNIGRSTSAGDYTKTGCFGLGFKSVFAFTATPQIISGDESFEIHRLSRVKGIERPVDLDATKTRIVLPFNHLKEKPDYVDRERSPEESFEEIGAKLRDIGLRTLLFTKKITEVKWAVGSENGHYLKEVHGNETYLTDGISEESYLIHSRNVKEWEGEKLDPISIAFRLENDRIVKIENRSLFVLFETALETHLGFLVNGAFRTTPSRENIKYEDGLNRYLIQELAILLEESLERVKDSGLLDVGFLQCLPIKIINEGSSVFPNWRLDYPEKWPFLPLYERVLAALGNSVNACLPADKEGHYTTTEAALLARGEELRSLFPDCILDKIWERQRVWLAGGITANNTPNLRNYLIHALDVKEISPPDLLGHLKESFYPQQSISWLIHFYQYVGETSERKNKVKSEDIPCIPLQSGRWVGAANKKVVFSSDGVSSAFALLPEVKNVAGERWEEVKRLLEFLGVHEFNREDEIQFLLDKYYRTDAKSKIQLNEHLNHIRLFISFWEENEYKAKSLLTTVPIFVTDDCPGVDLEKKELKAGDLVNSYLSSSTCYIDQPLKTTLLAFVLHENGDEPKRLLSHCYFELGTEFIRFAEGLGVQAGILPVESNVLKNPMIERSSGTENSQCTHVDWQLPPDIFSLLNADAGNNLAAYDKKFQAATLVWNMMSALDPKYFTAEYQKNSHRQLQKKPSKLIQQLSELPWLLHANAEEVWMRPCDLTEETLCTGVSEDYPEPIFDLSKATNGWLKFVRFGQSEDMQTAFKNSGEDYDEFLRYKKLQEKNPDLLEKLFEELEKEEVVAPEEISFAVSLGESFNRPGKTELDDEYEQEFDPDEIPNPDRIGRKLTDEIEKGKTDEPSPNVRHPVGIAKSIECRNPETKEFLLRQYQGKCQICGHRWAKRNGKPYFVAAYLIEVRNGRWIDRPGNAICLCADHFAQWKHAAKEQVYDISEWIASQKLAKEGGAGALVLEYKLLGKPKGIKYTERHFIELRTIVNESGKVSFTVD